MKRWRRSGGIGGTAPAVLVTETGGGLYEAAANPEFLAVPAATVDIFDVWNGVPVLNQGGQIWPFGAAVIDSGGHAGETLVSRWILNTGFTVNSDPVNVP